MCRILSFLIASLIFSPTQSLAQSCEKISGSHYASSIEELANTEFQEALSVCETSVESAHPGSQASVSNIWSIKRAIPQHQFACTAAQLNNDEAGIELHCNRTHQSIWWIVCCANSDFDEVGPKL